MYIHTYLSILRVKVWIDIDYYGTYGMQNLIILLLYDDYSAYF
jgi:hypothetical protein